MSLTYDFAFLDVRDCTCGLRYARHVIGVPRIQQSYASCQCGRCLEVWRGFYQLDFEPEERTRLPN